MKLVNFWEKSYRHRKAKRDPCHLYQQFDENVGLVFGGFVFPLCIFSFGIRTRWIDRRLESGNSGDSGREIIGDAAIFAFGKTGFRLGFKWSILLGSFLLSIYFLLPSIFPRSILLIVVMSVVAAFEILIYWIARLSIMSLDGEKPLWPRYQFSGNYRKTGFDTGAVCGRLSGSRGGFASMFAVVTVVSIISALPIFSFEIIK